MKGSNKDKKLMKKFANNEKLAPKNKVTKMDPAQLVNLELVQAAISGLRKLPTVGKIERKSLHDITDEDEHFVYLQVTLCKVSKVTDDFHLTGPTTVSVYLPNSLVTDSTDVILITKDLQRGIKKDHQNSLNYFKELLHVKGASSLISEIIPLRQLKLEYREFEAKRLLANRTDMLLCDDTIMRFIPKFLTKYFYVKKRLPVQVNLKAIDLQKEIQRALSVSKLFFSMKGNSSLMKIGRMGQTDEEIQQNVLAAVAKLASHAPGEWANIQSLSLKLERTSSIPIYANMNSLNKVKSVAPKQLFPGKPVSGTLTTVPGKCITVFPDGSVTVTSLRKNKSRLAKENETNEIEKKVDKSKSKGGKKNKERKKSAKSKSKVELPETETEVSTTKKEAGEKKTKRKMTEKKSSKAKKQKKVDGSDADSDLESEEDDLEKQEMLYLKQLNQEKESAGGQEKDEDSEEDVWADSDSDSNMEDSE
ncbi:Ribosomal L1 domain-containing protein 1 [Portunus trituberculatus]|uniref:Ribosomal L1 domain-containing protein 1 n=2 Tax=Portunus trituberculatus TaxID=210409 RepID=A0A5B7CYR6_PORTR|nr:Ribosomal L1 domain-containing protein 1 [Portunus trituberculatus]